MKANGWLRPLLAVSLALPYVSGVAQDLTVPELVKGDKLPATIKIADLTDDYKAVRLTVSGSSNMSDMFSGPYGMLIALSGGMSTRGDTGAQMEIVAMMDVSWTKGETIHLLSTENAVAKAAGVPKGGADDEYLITYKSGIGLAEMIGFRSGPGEVPQVLKLALVKLSSVSSITPAPEVTKERMAKAFAGLKSALAGSGPDTPVEVATTEAPAVEGPAGTTDQNVALSNARQITLGAIMYCTDYDDVMPYVNSVTTMKEVTMPYLKSMSVWDTKNPASQWRLNMSVSGVSMTDIPDPAVTPMYYESAPWPDGRRVVAFCDGHVELANQERWTALAKYLKLKLKRTAKKPLPLHVQGYVEPSPPPEAPGQHVDPPTKDELGR